MMKLLRFREVLVLLAFLASVPASSSEELRLATPRGSTAESHFADAVYGEDVNPPASTRYLRGFYASGNRSGGRGNPIVSMIFGCLLWCCIPCFLWNNERIAVKQSKLQGKAFHNAIEIEDPDREPLEEMNGHVVFMRGESTCQEQLVDSYFPQVSSTNCVKLRRIVQMYQWKEVKKGSGDDAHYVLEMHWEDDRQNGHDGRDIGNPPMPIPSSQRSMTDYRASVASGDGAGEQCAEASTYAIRLGAYYLGEFVRRELEAWVIKRVSINQMASGQALASRGNPREEAEGWWTYGEPGKGAMLGDVRVKFEELRCGHKSLCGVLAHVDGGYTIIPVFREEGEQGLTCAHEFGCTSCVSIHRPVFSHNPADDADLLEELEDMEAELTESERTRFLKQKTAFDQTFYAPHAHDLCCTFCLNDSCVKGMHYMGLEEEFLGVFEGEGHDIEEMLQKEKSMANRRHNCARLVGVLIGVLAAWMVISPITYILNYNWYISMFGGAALSCLISCSACLVSLIVTFFIIAVAWFKARPRLSGTLLLVICAIIGLWFYFLHQGHGMALPTTTAAFAPLMSTVTAAALGGPVTTTAAFVR